MDPRLNIEMAEHQQQEVHRKTRRRWPDGLPPRHKRVRPSPTLSSAALITELFWR